MNEDDAGNCTLKEVEAVADEWYTVARESKKLVLLLKLSLRWLKLWLDVIELRLQ